MKIRKKVTLSLLILAEVFLLTSCSETNEKITSSSAESAESSVSLAPTTAAGEEGLSYMDDIYIGHVTEEITKRYNTIHTQVVDENGLELILITKKPFRDLSFINIIAVSSSDGFNFSQQGILFEVDEWIPEEPIAITIYPGANLPSCGISFTGEDGTRQYFYIQESQKDGSVSLVEFENQTERDLAIGAYHAVLKSEVQFFSTDGGNYYDPKDGTFILLRDYLNSFEPQYKIDQFTVVDMDGDGIPEVVLDLSPVGFMEVLHYDGGTVYGYIFPYRAMQGLKQDGTFGFSNGAADSGYASLVFSAVTREYVEINDESKAQNVDWYEKTDENINTYLR